MLIRRFLLASIGALSLSLISGLAWAEDDAEDAPKEKKTTPDVVYVPTPNDVVAKMLQVGKVKKSDVVYDLGCGDGRIIVTAARKFGVKGVGYEINPVRIEEAEANIKKNKVEKLVTIKNEDLFEADLSEATLIAIYLLPEMNTKLVPQFNKMKPGSRVVSHAYGINGSEPDETYRITSKEDGADHVIYVWNIPIKLDAEDTADE